MADRKEPIINSEKIIEAGKALKSIVNAVLLMFFFEIILVAIISNSIDIELIKIISIFSGILSLAFIIYILIMFYQAGDSLVNVLVVGKIESYEKNDEAVEAVFVRYQTDKGVLEIPPCINFKGQKAFLDGEPAPDGKYKYSFMSYFHIKDGIIIKG
jgi:hypothetical protein